MKNYKELYVLLRGGLGNQLFGLYTGLALANKSDRKLILVLNDIDKDRTNGKFDITSFNLPAKVEIRHISQSEYFKVRVVRKTSRNFSNLGDLASTTFGLIADVGQKKIEKRLAMKFLNNRKRLYLDGYFQYIEYFEQAERSVQRLQLQSGSEWFQNLKARIEIEKPTAIHIRLGDYLENLETIGVLNSDYYRRSISRVLENKGKKMWVFSDDIPIACKILEEITDVEFELIRTPENSDPAESLVLMSLANNLIISNSTYSLWSGLMKIEVGNIVAPTIFYRGSTGNPFAIPENWIQEDPAWLEPKL